MLTEAGAALGFVAVLARSLAGRCPGDAVDEGREFRRYCRRLGLEPTDERHELAADAGAVVRELVGEAAADGEMLAALAPRVPLRLLVARLEAYGWKRAVLERPVGGTGRQ